MTKRTDKIIHVLLNRANGTTVRELSKMLNVSDRTIRNEIKSINNSLIANGLPIISQNRGSIDLNLTKNELDKFNNSNLMGDDGDYYTPNERFVILLLDILDNGSVVRIYREQKKLKVSKSTIDDDMRFLRRYIDNYSLVAISDPKNGMRITGNERSLRAMLSDVITEYTNLENLVISKVTHHDVIAERIEHFFANVDIQKIAKVFSKHVHEIDSDGNIANNFQSVLLTGIWIKRLMDGKIVGTEKNDQWKAPKDSISIYINEIINEFNCTNISITEYRYIYFIMNSFNSNLRVSNDKWTKTQLLTIRLITYMENEQDLPFSSREDLYEGLYNHLTGVIYRLGENVNSYNPLKEIIKANYSETYRLIKNFMDSYFDNTNKEISDDEICYITVYFTTAQMQIEKNWKYRYKVAVICNYGLATGHLLAANLEKEFNIEVVAVLSITDVSLLSKLSLDLVVKTIQVDTGNIPSIKLPPIPQKNDYLMVKDFFDNDTRLIRNSNTQDFNKLFEDVIKFISDMSITINNKLIDELSDIFQRNNLQITTKEVQPMLRDLLTDDKIQLQVEVDNWKEAIEQASKPLVDDGIINNNYVHAMLESVVKFGPYIVIGPGLALAHARPEEGANQLGVSVMTLKNPVKFGNKTNDPVTMVFCLSAVNNYSHLNVMKAVVRLVSDPGRIEKLSKIKDLSEFKKELFETEIKAG